MIWAPSAPLFSRVPPRLRYSHSRLLCSASVPLRLLLFAFYISSCGVSVLLSLCAVYIPALYCSFIFNFLNCSSGTASILVQYTFSDSIFYRILFLSPCGICCVMQWIFPPPRRISLAGIGQIFLSGKTVPRISTAVLSCSSPNCGTTTPPFEI